MSTTNMKEILGHVMNMDRMQLNAVIEAINARRRYLSDVKKKSFEVGQEVFIQHHNHGYANPCVIIKIMKKNIRVLSVYDKIEYDVSPSLLLSVSDYKKEKQGQ